MQGTLFGDPDFESLILVAGQGGGSPPLPPSWGHTTLTDRGDGTFHVDSFFDITYQIDFVGAPGGVLDGLSGSTQGTTRNEARGTRDPCIIADDGTGTVELPPPGCEYLDIPGRHQIIVGLPPGTTIELEPRYLAFLCPTGVCGQPGGSLGGEQELFQGELVLQAEGTGALADFRRTLRLPFAAETHTGPRTPGDPIQSFAADLINLQGSLFGDPDFASLQITEGSGNGLPSPGHITLTDLGDGTFHVDSFFDITYQIDFVGAPGSVLEGFGGSTELTATINTREGHENAIEPDDGTGTATLPPEGAAYLGLIDRLAILDGLPPGSSVALGPRLWLFFCDSVPCSQAGGTLGGDSENFQALLSLDLEGSGVFAGYTRSLTLPVAVESHSGPRSAGGPLQIFDHDLFLLQGVIFGDPDFLQLAITAGTGNTLPSPGHTTLTDQGDGTFLVDSFFDITYEIDFIGAPGSLFDGLSGTTQGAARITAVEDPLAPARNITITLDADGTGPTDVGFEGDLSAFALDDDADPTLPSSRIFFNLSPGLYSLNEAVVGAWSHMDIVCDDPDGGTTADALAGTLDIDLDFAEAITCTFNDTLIFADGFESGDVSAWSSAVGVAP
jgi:hypothetical protein